MTPLMSLWLPIIVSAVAVFLLSFLVHMILPWHKGDYAAVPNEDGVMDALRAQAIPPGDYMMPRPASRKDMGSPEFAAKRARGPVAMLTIIPPGPPTMGPYLAKWFVYLLVVTGLVACFVGATLGPAAHDHAIFHHVAYIAFLAYAVGMWPQSIWYHRAWRITLLSTFDSLLYAVATGLIFTWMWPK